MILGYDLCDSNKKVTFDFSKVRCRKVIEGIEKRTNL